MQALVFAEESEIKKAGDQPAFNQISQCNN